MEGKVASNSTNVMSQSLNTRYEWKTIPWRKLEVSVFKLQKRIYQASQRNDVKLVHQLQKLLLKSESAKLLAVRRVTQDNQGRKTAGVDGVANLKPEERLKLVESLKMEGKSKPVRRVWIPKPGKTEKRPLGIPVMAERAEQALLKMALEPEWEAKFEPNSYGFRPGRSCHDSCAAIYNAIRLKASFVLDADISACFDKIDQTTLLAKLNTTPTLRRILKGWLRAGVIDGNVFSRTERGAPAGGVISPLLANIALHGMECDTKKALTKELFQHIKKKHASANKIQAQNTISIIRYADDFVVIHEDKEIVLKAKTFIEGWLRKIGLELSASKTRMVHTLNPIEDKNPGFNFLGFTVRQFRNNRSKRGYKTLIKPSKESQKRHAEMIRIKLRHARTHTQEEVIDILNPIVKGWSRYFIPVVSSEVFSRLDNDMHYKLWRWALRRHPNKNKHWVRRKYFRQHKGDMWRFKTHEGKYLSCHKDHHIKRHVKVKGTRTPYDGDWVYWSTRMGRSPETPPRIAKLLKLQEGKCSQCKLWLNCKDRMEVHHIDKNHKNSKIENLSLLHLHCHDTVHRAMCA